MHIYTNSQGVSLPSVTEIIQKTRPLSEVIKLNAAIEKKKAREGLSNKDWDNYMAVAQDRGTNLHHFMEIVFPLIQEANGYALKEKEVPESLLKKIKALQNFWEEDVKIGAYVKSLNQFTKELNKQTRDWEILSSEEALVNEELGYGGRCDTLLRIGENHVLLDLKSNGGYYSQWKQCQVYGWNLWRKPKKEDVMVVKQYANGNSKEVRKKDINGKVVKKEEEMPPEHERDWDWVDSKIKDKFVQLCLYIMAARSMKEKGKFQHDIHGGAILVCFPGSYQYIKMPNSVWDGCKSEAVSRVERYMQEYLQKWRLEVSLMHS